MSRFRIPTRISPSPAAEEPGLQNSAARLRSSREVQTRLLAERRSGESEERGQAAEGQDAITSVVADETAANPGKREGDAPLDQRAAHQAKHSDHSTGKVRKEKLVVLFRLPLATEHLIAEVPGAADVSPAYALRAFAKEGRAELRRLGAEADLVPFTAAAKSVLELAGTAMTLGEPMTVYVQPKIIEAMHNVLGDPWKIEPRATIIGAFLAAIVMRLIETRRAG